jgi:hypothetical protein
MNLKYHLRILVYLFLQLCFAEILSCVFYTIENDTFLIGVNNLVIYAVSSVLITIISIAKIKIIESLLQMEIMLTLIFELCISLRMLNISTIVTTEDFLSINIPYDFSLPSITNLLCIVSFIAYFVLLYKNDKGTFSIKHHMKYIMLTFIYKIIELGVWFYISDNYSSLYPTINADFNTTFLINTSINLVGIFIFLYIYFASKISIISTLNESQYSSMEVIVLFIGAIPMIQLFPIAILILLFSQIFF